MEFLELHLVQEEFLDGDIISTWDDYILWGLCFLFWTDFVLKWRCGFECILVFSVKLLWKLINKTFRIVPCALMDCNSFFNEMEVTFFFGGKKSWVDYKKNFMVKNTYLNHNHIEKGNFSKTLINRYRIMILYNLFFCF
jgi:hypothetical protein